MKKVKGIFKIAGVPLKMCGKRSKIFTIAGGEHPRPRSKEEGDREGRTGGILIFSGEIWRRRSI